MESRVFEVGVHSLSKSEEVEFAEKDALNLAECMQLLGCFISEENLAWLSDDPALYMVGFPTVTTLSVTKRTLH